MHYSILYTLHFTSYTVPTTNGIILRLSQRCDSHQATPFLVDKNILRVHGRSTQMVHGTERILAVILQFLLCSLHCINLLYILHFICGIFSPNQLFLTIIILFWRKYSSHIWCAATTKNQVLYAMR